MLISIVDHQLEVSYQVIEISRRFDWMSMGSRADLKITFVLSGPENEVHVHGKNSSVVKHKSVTII